MHCLYNLCTLQLQRINMNTYECTTSFNNNCSSVHPSSVQAACTGSMGAQVVALHIQSWKNGLIDQYYVLEQTQHNMLCQQLQKRKLESLHRQDFPFDFHLLEYFILFQFIMLSYMLQGLVQNFLLITLVYYVALYVPSFSLGFFAYHSQLLHL